MDEFLQVQPFADIVDSVRLNVPRLLFNRDLVGPFHQRLKRRTDVASTGELPLLVILHIVM